MATSRNQAPPPEDPVDVPADVQEAPDRPWTEEELTHVDPSTGAWAPALKQHWPESQPAKAEGAEEVTDNA